MNLFVGLKRDTVNYMTTWENVGASCEGAEKTTEKAQIRVLLREVREGETGRRKRKRGVDSSKEILVDRKGSWGKVRQAQRVSSAFLKSVSRP